MSAGETFSAVVSVFGLGYSVGLAFVVLVLVTARRRGGE